MAFRLFTCSINRLAHRRLKLGIARFLNNLNCWWLSCVYLVMCIDWKLIKCFILFEVLGCCVIYHRILLLFCMIFQTISIFLYFSRSLLLTFDICLVLSTIINRWLFMKLVNFLMDQTSGCAIETRRNIQEHLPSLMLYLGFRK